MNRCCLSYSDVAAIQSKDFLQLYAAPIWYGILKSDVSI